eukprot:849879-Rhodomonas_salina.1
MHCAVHPEIKYKKPPFQYDLCQECGFLYLISGCKGIGHLSKRTQAKPLFVHSQPPAPPKAHACSAPHTVSHLAG